MQIPLFVKYTTDLGLEVSINLFAIGAVTPSPTASGCRVYVAGVAEPIRLEMGPEKFIADVGQRIEKSQGHLR